MAKKKKLLTPQQEKFLALYTNPQSKTFGNASASAIEAEYSETYAHNITDAMPSWLLEKIGDTRLLNKAVKVLDKTLEEGYDEYETEEGLRRDSSLSRISQDSAKFIAETVGKKRFSKRSGLLDDEGNPIPTPIYGGLAIKTVSLQGHDGDQKGLSAPQEDTVR